MSDNDTDVIIIGAGMSGLSAALTFTDMNGLPGAKPTRFIVLEGSSRTGGRTVTIEHESGALLDFGGQYLANSRMQTYAWSLVERFGIDTDMFKTWIPQKDVDSVYEGADGTRKTFVGSYPEDDNIKAAVGLIEWYVMLLKSHLGAPWNALDAGQLDQMSVAQWGQLMFNDPFTRELLAVAVRCAYSVEPEEISLLHFFHYGATCGSFRAYEDVVDGGDAYRFRGGTKSLVDKLVEAIGKENFRLGAKVVAVKQDSDGVTVGIEDGQNSSELRAERVIVAMSPSATGGIDWSPALPEARIRVVGGMPMAHTIKGFALFKDMWWRDQFSGFVLSAKGPAHWIMDNCNQIADDKFDHPCLMTFVVGAEAVKRGGDENRAQRKNDALDQIARVFNKTRAFVDGALVDYVDWDWGTNKWAKGCPANCFAPGILTAKVGDYVVGRALAEPVGRIHWAGAETATDWMGGYMNGAIQAGMRAAAEVAKART